MRHIPKPQDSEFAPYTRMYIDLLPDDNRVLEHMRSNFQQIVDLVEGLPDAFLSQPHAPGEWTIKQILVHIVDDERIYAYRALRVARGDQTELPGFDQDAFALASEANERSLDNILCEYRAVRDSTLAMFDSFNDAILLRSGISDGKIMSVRAAAYHIAGHELHHLRSIKENYNLWKEDDDRSTISSRNRERMYIGGAAVDQYKNDEPVAMTCPSCGKLLIVTHVKGADTYWVKCPTSKCYTLRIASIAPEK